MLSSRLIPFHFVTSKSPQAFAFALLTIYRPQYPKPVFYRNTCALPRKPATVFRESSMGGLSLLVPAFSLAGLLDCPSSVSLGGTCSPSLFISYIYQEILRGWMVPQAPSGPLCTRDLV